MAVIANKEDTQSREDRGCEVTMNEVRLRKSVVQHNEERALGEGVVPF